MRLESAGRFAATLLLAAITCGCGDSTDSTDPFSPENFVFPTAYNPVWLPGDSAIGFTRSPIDGIDPGGAYHFVDSLRGWWTVGVNGEGLTQRLHFALPFADVSASGWIAYERVDRIAIIPSNGLTPDSNQTQLLSTPTFAHLPRWSTDGDSLVYRTYAEESGVAAADGQAAHIVSSRLVTASWVPGQHAIVGAARDDNPLGTGRRIIERLNLSTLETDTLRIDQVQVSYPRFSADGTLLAFARETGGSSIWVANADGTNAREVVPHTHGPFSWSHQGHWIAYLNYRWGEWSYSNSSVWIVDVDTGLRSQVLAGGAAR